MQSIIIVWTFSTDNNNSTSYTNVFQNSSPSFSSIVSYFPKREHLVYVDRQNHPQLIRAPMNNFKRKGRNKKKKLPWDQAWHRFIWGLYFKYVGILFWKHNYWFYCSGYRTSWWWWWIRNRTRPYPITVMDETLLKYCGNMWTKQNLHIESFTPAFQLSILL